MRSLFRARHQRPPSLRHPGTFDGESCIDGCSFGQYMVGEQCQGRVILRYGVSGEIWRTRTEPEEGAGNGIEDLGKVLGTVAGAIRLEIADVAEKFTDDVATELDLVGVVDRGRVFIVEIDVDLDSAGHGNTR